MAVLGCLLGTAVGDALGLPYEGLSPRRAARMLGPPSRHRLLFGRGMVSDDTEQSVQVLQSLLTSGGDRQQFQRAFAARLRWWLASLPVGTGLATARAILKLWVGIRPPGSGVFSAGNGPAMRSAILGVMLPEPQMVDLVTANATVTHSDPKATWGALAVALAARMSADSTAASPVSGDDYLTRLGSLLTAPASTEFVDMVAQSIEAISEYATTADFCAARGWHRGVSGYVYHTVPVAIQSWLRHPQDYSAALHDVITCGGDADTTAAIVGGIVGAGVGASGIPHDWQAGLIDWPLSQTWLTRLAAAAETWQPLQQRRPPELNPVGRLPRNLVFLMIVLSHGFRRLAPPW